MTIDTIKSALPDYAKDLKLNLSSVLRASGSPGLNEMQIQGTALAAAMASRNPKLLDLMEQASAETLDAATRRAAKAACATMSMNNVYYRFTDLAGNEDYARLPAKLRMNVIGNPGIAKADFELFCLAVSAINGCGKCVSAHERTLRQQGLSAEAVQSAARIAAVVHAVAVVLEVETQTSAGVAGAAA
jgi:alkyl hydroperoxide reductase subunit D